MRRKWRHCLLIHSTQIRIREARVLKTGPRVSTDSLMMWTQRFLAALGVTVAVVAGPVLGASAETTDSGGEPPPVGGDPQIAPADSPQDEPPAVEPGPDAGAGQSAVEEPPAPIMEAGGQVPDHDLDQVADEATTQAAEESMQSSDAQSGAVVEESAFGYEERPTPPDMRDIWRTVPGMATSPDGEEVVLYGGGQTQGGEAYSDTWVWTDGAWTPRCGTVLPGADGPCGPARRGMHAMGTGPTGVVLYGGASNAFGPEPPEHVHGDTWVWREGEWTMVCDTGVCGPGVRIAAAMAGNGSSVLLFGGISDSGPGMMEDTWIFDGASWSQACGISIGRSCGPVARAGSTMGWDGSRFLLFGGGIIDDGDQQPVGVEESVFHSDTWIWDGSAWLQVCGEPLEPCGPEGRLFGSIGFLDSPDPDLRGAVLTGGMGEGVSPGMTAFAGMWFWDGDGWTHLDAPWADSVPLDEGEPPQGSLLFTSVAGDPNSCQVLLTGILVGEDESSSGMATFSTGWDLAGGGRPSVCADQVEPEPVAPVTPPAPSPAPPPADPATPAAPPVVPIASTGPGSEEPSVEGALAFTGTSALGLVELAVALIALGSVLLSVGRVRPRSTRPRSS